MATKWLNPATGAIIDTNVAGITAEGTYYLLRNALDAKRPFIFGAKVKAAGHTATVQLFAEVASAKTNLGGPLTPSNGSPVMGADEYTLTGERGIIVTGLTGTVYPEVGQ